MTRFTNETCRGPATKGIQGQLRASLISDESISLKGRLSFVQYLQKKPGEGLGVGKFPARVHLGVATLYWEEDNAQQDQGLAHTVVMDFVNEEMLEGKGVYGQLLF